MAHQQREIDVGFGRYLRTMRESRRLSLDAVEEMTVSYPGRVTKSHLSRIENGQAEPTFPRMYALSQVYGVPISALAERFEGDLRRQSAPPRLEQASSVELVKLADDYAKEGRHIECLSCVELLIDRYRDNAAGAMQDVPTLNMLRIRRASCLASLERLATARDECEELLAEPDLPTHERSLALFYFASCSSRLGRYTVALMAIAQLKEELPRLADPGSMRAHVAGLEGSLFAATSRWPDALVAFQEGVEAYEALGDTFEACRQQINYGAALDECGKPVEARRQLVAALRTAQERGYDRQTARALHTLGRVSYRQGDPGGAASQLIESNRLAREREYVLMVFCNCFYLWRIAVEGGHHEAAAAHRRTLRAYLGRVPEPTAEAREFRRFEAGGDA